MPGNAMIVMHKDVPDDIAAKVEAGLKASMDDPDFTKILEKSSFRSASFPPLNWVRSSLKTKKA